MNAEDAACRDADPALFFPEMGKREPGRNARIAIARAKMICAGCPIREECAEAGRDEEYGVWGGLSPAERSARRWADAPRRQGSWDRIETMTATAMVKVECPECGRAFSQLGLGGHRKMVHGVGGTPANLRRLHNLRRRDRAAS